MTPGEKTAGVRRLAPWFHRIDLGDGVVTKSASVAGEAADHPLPTWGVLSGALPEDLTGLSVLDVGCNAGFYSVEAKRRGAARVLGVDAQRHQVRQASFVARALGLPMEFRRMSVYDLSPESVGVFDVTLALGLVYHLKHLVQGLERLHSVTGDLLLLETAVLLPELVPTSALPYVTGPLTRNLHPIGYVENAPDAKEAVYNWFVPSVGAMAAMLSDTGFDDVRCVATPGDRAVFVCRRRAHGRVQVLPDLEAQLEIVSAPGSCRLGERVTLEVRAANAGRSPWPAEGGTDGTGRVALGAHLFRGDEEVEWVWGREALPADVPPGGSTVLALEASAPLEAGAYRVELDLVAENLAWFEDLGVPLLEVPLVVTDEPAPMPWYAIAGLEEGAARRGATVPAGIAYAGLLRLAADALAGLPPAEQARQAFLWAVGWVPEASAVQEIVTTHLAGDGGLVAAFHALVGDAGRRPAPQAPPPARRAALLALAPSAPGTCVPLNGESFPGEAAAARGLLAEGAPLDDEAFVARAYEAVLGRPADPEGLLNAVTRLSEGGTTRAHLVRELLWSDELRTP